MDPWPTVSNEAKDLIRRMLVRNPKKRLTAHEVLCELDSRVLGMSLSRYSSVVACEEAPFCFSDIFGWECPKTIKLAVIFTIISTV